MESGEGIESSSFKPKILVMAGWNPVKELKAVSALSIDRAKALAKWNPVKELKVIYSYGILHD